MSLSINYEELRFWDAYGLAEDIRLLVQEKSEDIQIDAHFDIADAETRMRLASPQRWTLLHQFIQDWYVVHSIYGFEHHRDDMRYLVIGEYEQVLKGYDITYSKVEIPEESDAEYDKATSEGIAYLRQLLPIRRIANETFQLLFGNRSFLLDFNFIISEAVRNLKLDEYADVLNRDGVLRRQQLPAWAKRGVFFRDRGRCILCGKDLTGTVFTGEEVHYDHIVALAEGGNNDPINFQILCRECNLRKATRSNTSRVYPVYWSIEP